VLCYQYGGESRSRLQQSGSPANWRCMVVEKRRAGKVIGRSSAHSTKPLPSNILRGDADIDAEDHPVRDPQNGQ
jgi:hypothetical protein